VFDDEYAQANYQDFKAHVIALLPQDEDWVMSENVIKIFMRFLESR